MARKSLGRPAPRQTRGLSQNERQKLRDILDSGPVAYGFRNRHLDLTLVSQIIGEEFHQHYHPGHVRKLLRQLATRCNGPRRVWSRLTPGRSASGSLHLSQAKKKRRSEGAVIVFEDEASFRQHPPCMRPGRAGASNLKFPPRRAQHAKIFGAVRLDTAQFVYLHQPDYFQWETYLAFVDQILVPTFTGAAIESI